MKKELHLYTEDGKLYAVTSKEFASTVRNVTFSVNNTTITYDAKNMLYAAIQQGGDYSAIMLRGRFIHLKAPFPISLGPRPSLSGKCTKETLDMIEIDNTTPSQWEGSPILEEK